MLDQFFLPDDSINIKRYLAGNGGATDFFSWEKPRGARTVYIWVLGAGGGGGAGLTGAAASARGGGGGGGGGAICRTIIPAQFLPDILYVRVGKGGLGGASSGNAGGTGGISFVALVNDITAASNFIVNSSSIGGGAVGGVAGTSAGAQAGGAAAGQAANSASGPFLVLGTFVSQTGVNGSAAGALGSPGAAQTQFVGTVISGGAGGGSVNTNNTDVAGGAQTALGPFLGLAGGVAGGGNGNDGVTNLRPFYASGGSGGGTNGAAGTGGKGGNGGLGCGGGGGGGAVTGGAGGNGGDGLIVIITY